MELFIVESPAKCSKIKSYLPKNFVVEASVGHVRDLKKKTISIDIENGFTPDYDILPDKRRVVSNLKAKAKKASVIWLAPDPDREGERIAWDLEYIFRNDLNIPPDKIKRITLIKSPRKAILESIKNPRKIDYNLVSAQEVRRILDRIVGYKVSPILWNTIQGSVSAGRVQSIVAKLIVDKDREISKFTSGFTFKVSANFITDSISFSGSYFKVVPSKDLVVNLFNRMKTGSVFLKRN